MKNKDLVFAHKFEYILAQESPKENFLIKFLIVMEPATITQNEFTEIFGESSDYKDLFRFSDTHNDSENPTDEELSVSEKF